jgi:hypothetical protein
MYRFSQLVSPRRDEYRAQHGDDAVKHQNESRHQSRNSTLPDRESGARAAIGRLSPETISEDQWRQQRDRLFAYVQLLRAWDACRTLPRKS